MRRRERCTAEGTWSEEDYLCTIDLDGVAEQNLFCALKADGRITCFGDDFELDQVAPIQTGNWRRIFLTDDFALTNICALDDQSDAQCWGRGGMVRIFRGPILDITVGQYGIFTILGDGRIVARDSLMVKDALGSEPTGPFVRLAMNDNTLFALHANGTMYGPVPFPSGIYSELSLSNIGNCAIDANKHVVCSPPERADPAIAQERFVAIEQQDIGGVCGIRVDGTVLCWDGHPAGSTLKPPAGKFTKLAASGPGMCGLRVDGTVTCWGENVKMPPKGL